MSPQYDTIVIGLGAAGTSAARALARAGRRVLAVEAAARVGGRVRTVAAAAGAVELGAEWIHGTQNNCVHDLALANNIDVQYQDLDLKLWTSDGSPGNEELINELVNFCLQVVDNPPEKPEPLGQFVTRNVMEYINEKYPEVAKDKDFIEQFLEFMDLLIDNYESSNNWNDVSAWTKYDELNGHQHGSWHKHGYKTFFDILLNKHNNGPGWPTLEIKLETEVTLISCPVNPEDPVRVTTKDGTVYEADTAIVTVSIGVLKEKHKTLFKPPLPQAKVAAIDNISIGVMDKVILSFPYVWWPKDKQFHAFLWKGKDKRALKGDWHTKIFGASSPLGSANCITLWTNGDVAKLVETLPEDVVKRKCMELLRRFMGKELDIPEPTGIMRSTWYSNPYTRGSYTYDNLLVAEHPTARADLRAPLCDASGRPRVLFAGEATDETHFSTVHGAADSGRREAARLLPCACKI